MQTAELGEEHPQTLITMHSPGGLSPRNRRYPGVREGACLLGRTLELRRRVLGEEHPDTLVSMRSPCYGSLGRDDEAERLLRQVLETQSRKFGETHRKKP